MTEKRILFVGFSRPKNKWKIGAAIIRWFESEYRVIWDPRSWFSFFFASHVFKVYPANPYRDFFMVNEAVGHEVRYVSQQNFEPYVEIMALYKFEFSKEVYSEIKNYSEKFAGTPYAFWENIGLGLARILESLVGVRIKNPFARGDAAQKCSELIVRNIILRLESYTWTGLLAALSIKKGIYIPKDIDLIGVRDIFHLLEFLAEVGHCERVANDTKLRVSNE